MIRLNSMEAKMHGASFYKFTVAYDCSKCGCEGVYRELTSGYMDNLFLLCPGCDARVKFTDIYKETTNHDFRG